MTGNERPGDARDVRDVRDALDQRLDEVLAELRDGYHVSPAAPPLDAMWARIDRALDGMDGEATVVPLRLTAAAPRVRVLRAGRWLGLAATLVVGIGIGRLSVRPEGADGTGTAAPVAQRSDGPRQRPSGPERAAEPATRGMQTASAPAPRGEPAASPATVARAASFERGTAPPPSALEDQGAGTDPVSPRRYLGQATALLIALADESPSAREDARLARRAADLLATTRLLLDAPSTDAKTRALLEDLELVLAQVVGLQTDAGREELRLIREALDQRELLPRLHTAAVATADE